MKRIPITAEDFAIVMAAIERGAGHVIKAMTNEEPHEAKLFKELREVGDYIKSAGCSYKGINNSFAFWDKSIV